MYKAFIVCIDPSLSSNIPCGLAVLDDDGRVIRKCLDDTQRSGDMKEQQDILFDQLLKPFNDVKYFVIVRSPTDLESIYYDRVINRWPGVVIITKCYRGPDWHARSDDVAEQVAKAVYTDYKPINQ